METLHFPCFTSGTICAHGYCHFPFLNVPVHVGGVMVHPGDLLHGDRNGVTTIPHAIASEVAHACADFVAAEAVVLDYLKAGKVDVKENTPRARNTCKEMIDAAGCADSRASGLNETRRSGSYATEQRLIC